eukprot:CAMPEP_0202878932 /NCGR_PEP_ID=MMETSP1391-20130828/32951_1 /ASSEMBLY_ACC=CAM_ASM_000867 /TAXON_ID=1034604 /ORGANISM="Chlamydomonas leiostraca, Strain SAG 11-49" /LENGTH=78 /DNA_ID=CAMNT_0049561225 /DNA_START=59 /DNA_END=295 /DNA_ORIENTATION=+
MMCGYECGMTTWTGFAWWAPYVHMGQLAMPARCMVSAEAVGADHGAYPTPQGVKYLPAWQNNSHTLHDQLVAAHTLAV